MNTTARFLLRAALAAAIAGLGSAGVAAINGTISLAEGIGIASAAVGAFGAWVGVGALSPQVEPSIGRKLEE